MQAFGRELDQLEETTILLALVFLVSTGLTAALGVAVTHVHQGGVAFSVIALLGLFAALARGLSFAAGAISLLLWAFRSCGLGVYERLPLHKDKLQHLFKR
jgi:hypothetical protein